MEQVRLGPRIRGTGLNVKEPTQEKNLRKTLVALFLFACANGLIFAGHPQDPSNNAFVGKWSGTISIGDGAPGDLYLPITKQADGKLSARIIINTVRGLELDRVFHAVAVTGNKVEMWYPPAKGEIEIIVNATLE